MKGIAQILFGCAMLLLSIFSAVMFSVSGGGYLFIGLIMVAPFVGVLFALCGLINASQNLEKGNQMDKRNEEKQESEKKGEENESTKQN